ncbi:MAG TPA: 16S rRNA (cytosine(1402)-N(4))-methyltransferase, partial [Dehalococcoidia bacterium]|nr:16S rRNA (cytosine(1402)-N(4))-methyltransferase [Dehalococcoidia bacterium]
MDRTGHNPGEIAVSHEPVLLAESVQHLMLKEAGVYVDGTTGQGGHSEAMLLAEPQVKAVLGIDWDPRSLEFAQSRLADFADRFLSAAGSYTQMVELAAGQGISSVDGVLLDLGFSSLQIEGPEYGLSFQEDGPLDMRYNPEGGLTAEEIISSYSEHELGQIIRRYGEEPRGMAIARAIIKERPVQGTAQLASIVGSVLGRRPGQRVSPATKTFQALRIAVNDELSNVERGIDAAITLLAPGGRLAVISYHSLEDRII